MKQHMKSSISRQLFIAQNVNTSPGKLSARVHTNVNENSNAYNGVVKTPPRSARKLEEAESVVLKSPEVFKVYEKAMMEIEKKYQAKGKSRSP